MLDVPLGFQVVVGVVAVIIAVISLGMKTDKNHPILYRVIAIGTLIAGIASVIDGFTK